MNIDINEHQDIIDKLTHELATEKRKNKSLNADIVAAKEALVNNALRAEAEEECIINKFNRKCGEVSYC